MKVLFLISGGDSGGAKTHLFALLDSLKTKAQVKMVCFMQGVFYKEILERDIDTQLLEQKSRFDMSVLSVLRDMVEKEGFDIVHCHGARANFIAARLKKKITCPVVTTVHSDYRLDFDGIYRKLTYTSLNMWALRKMDYYIGVSSSFKQMLISRGFKPNRIFTVYNGMDFSAPLHYEEKEAFLRRIGTQAIPGEVLVGIIGRHDYVKGHDVFIKGCCETAKRYKNVRFLVAGDRDGEQTLRKIAQDAGFEDRFIFCGFIKDIYSFINAVDINTITSRMESFPYVMLEGARLKKPLVTSRVGGISDLVIEGETGLLFESENHMQFSDKLGVLIESPEKREELGEALHERATSVFSSENLANEHMKIYNSILRYTADGKEYDAALCGYYGFNNSGDDALLHAILSSLRKLMPDIRVIVLTNRPKEGRRQCMVDTAHRFAPFALTKTLKNSRMLLFGGGSLLQDGTSSQSLYYYLYVLNSAKRHGAHIYVFANGIGPLKKHNIKYVRKTLSLADTITLRDSGSARELEVILPGCKYMVTADPAIGLKGEPIGAEILIKEGIAPECRKIGISVKSYKKMDADFEDKLVLVLDTLYTEHSLVPVFIPMKHPEDVKISERICERLSAPGHVLAQQYNVLDLVAVISEMDVILGMRLHTLIFAAGNSVPCVGIIYDPKVKSFMEYIGQESFLYADSFDAHKCLEYVNGLIENADGVKQGLARKTEELSALAFKNSEIAVSIIKRNEFEQ